MGAVDYFRIVSDVSDYWGRRFPFPNWDVLFLTRDCPHCDGSGVGPCADGVTPCGWCDGGFL